LRTAAAGTALLHARTETEWFHICWENAAAILFVVKRLIFVYAVRDPLRELADSLRWIVKACQDCIFISEWALQIGIVAKQTEMARSSPGGLG
jgi:hypothetical protein